MVSAHALPSYVERAQQLGCDRYITKPIKINTIREAVIKHKERLNSQINSRRDS